MNNVQAAATLSIAEEAVLAVENGFEIKEKKNRKEKKRVGG